MTEIVSRPTFKKESQIFSTVIIHNLDQAQPNNKRL